MGGTRRIVSRGLPEAPKRGRGSLAKAAVGKAPEVLLRHGGSGRVLERRPRLDREGEALFDQVSLRKATEVLVQQAQGPACVAILPQRTRGLEHQARLRAGRRWLGLRRPLRSERRTHPWG